MKKSILAALTALLTVGGMAAAQVYEYPAYDTYGYGAYGDVGYGDYQELEGYDEAGVGYPYGGLVLTTMGTQEQSIDIVITGPNGYSETFESEAGVGRELVELPVGTYSIAATDDGLEMGHALVEVRAGFGQALTFTLPPFEQQAMGGVGEGYGLEAGYYGVEEEFGDAYEPYGYYEVEGYEAYENEEAGAVVVAVEGVNEAGEAIGYEELGVEVTGHIVGPDDERTEFGGAETNFEDLPSGIYTIAATAEGYRVAQTYLQVQPGQTALVRVRMQGLQTGVVGGAEAVETETVAVEPMARTGIGAGLYGAWDADADGALASDEFETGLYGTIAGDDGELTEDEFGEGFGRLYGEGYESQYAFSDFDADMDGVVTETEFSGAYEAGLYNEWDANADATLTLDEYNRGWFGTLDANRDARITQEEYQPYEGWFGYGYDEFGAGEQGVGEEGWLGFGG